jgi:hypothetical protein
VIVATAAREAYREGNPTVFDFLIKTERCLEGEAAPLVADLFRLLRGQGEEEAPLDPQREEMLRVFLRKWPHTVETVWLWEGPTCQRALEAAVGVRSTKLVETVLSLGGNVRYDTGNVVIDGTSYPFFPTLFYALRWPSLPVMKLVMEAGVLESWKTKYSEDALNVAGAGLFATLLGCYPRLAPQNADSLATLDLLLSTGFCHSWMASADGSVANICVGLLSMEQVQSAVAEEHIIDLLSRCRAAGMDIVRTKKEGVECATLVWKAAQAGLNKVLDFAVEVQGLGSIESWCEQRISEGKVAKSTPLLEAIVRRRLSTVRHLLRVHKAKAAYRGSGFDVLDQPIFQALLLRDDAAPPFVQELIAVDPLLCTIDSFSNTGKANPLFICCTIPLPRCLEALLSAKLPGLQEFCSQVTRQDDGKGHFFHATPPCALANCSEWDLLATLLHHYPDLPVTVPGRIEGPDGTLIQNLLCVVDSAERHGAPRALLLKLRANANQQRTEAEKAGTVAANSAAPSNAFEDPTNKVLTEAEEKKKAKKRKKKKKAKAKKRGAAAKKEGHAGAGKEDGEADSSDSDSSGPDADEEGMGEEERMLARAPTFDLEKEKAARKARAEAEKASQTKE